MWPDHCVQDTTGAEFHPNLTRIASDFIVQKGTDIAVDSYSAFSDNSGRNPTPLEARLKEEHIDEVYVCGLALDVCVKFTAIDALHAGFTTTVVVDASSPVTPEGGAAALKFLEQEGCHLAEADAVQ
jgi:nicotinamidase/pyrazinamidase